MVFTIPLKKIFFELEGKWLKNELRITQILTSPFFHYFIIIVRNSLTHSIEYWSLTCLSVIINFLPYDCLFSHHCFSNWKKNKKINEINEEDSNCNHCFISWIFCVFLLNASLQQNYVWFTCIFFFVILRLIRQSDIWISWRRVVDFTLWIQI